MLIWKSGEVAERGTKNSCYLIQIFWFMGWLPLRRSLTSLLPVGKQFFMEHRPAFSSFLSLFLILQVVKSSGVWLFCGLRWTVANLGQEYTPSIGHERKPTVCWLRSLFLTYNCSFRWDSSSHLYPAWLIYIYNVLVTFCSRKKRQEISFDGPDKMRQIVLRLLNRSLRWACCQNNIVFVSEISNTRTAIDGVVSSVF